MMKHALIAVFYLALGSAGAFAATSSSCSIANMVFGGVPEGTFETFGLGSTGTLDGYFTDSYYECDHPGGTLLTTPESTTLISNAVIPFYVSLTDAANVTISVAAGFSFPEATFDLFLDGSTTADAIDVASGADTTLAIPAGLNTLGITENYVATAPALGAGDPTDTLSVGVSLVNLITPVPEPATLGLLGFGATCLVGLRRRRRPA